MGYTAGIVSCPTAVGIWGAGKNRIIIVPESAETSRRQHDSPVSGVQAQVDTSWLVYSAGLEAKNRTDS